MKEGVSVTETKRSGVQWSERDEGGVVTVYKTSFWCDAVKASYILLYLYNILYKSGQLIHVHGKKAQ